MLKNVDVNKLADKIRESSYEVIEGSAVNIAEYFISNTDERLEPAVLAWIEGREIPNITHGEYSISDIMHYQNNDNFIYVAGLLSEYMVDPERAKFRIHEPTYDVDYWFLN